MFLDSLKIFVRHIAKAALVRLINWRRPLFFRLLLFYIDLWRGLQYGNLEKNIKLNIYSNYIKMKAQ
jgi:hypothetical protein